MPSTEFSPVISETAPRLRRSVFSNYVPAEDMGEAELLDQPPANEPPAVTVESVPELALTRSFVHQFLARAFDYPNAETWAWLSAGKTREGLAAAVAALDAQPAGTLRAAQAAFARAGLPEAFDAVHDDYVLAIGHAARGSCPINEIEYGDIKADPLFQPHRLADLAAFYRAFGMELGADSGERHDHLSIELEFMSALTAQEASLRHIALVTEALTICRDAQRKFLREHLGRWAPAFTRRLQRAVGDRPLGLLARFALAFIESECARLDVALGSADLLLRPADEAASLCDGCGLAQTLPGAPGGATPE